MERERLREIESETERQTERQRQIDKKTLRQIDRHRLRQRGVERWWQRERERRWRVGGSERDKETEELNRARTDRRTEGAVTTTPPPKKKKQKKKNTLLTSLSISLPASLRNALTSPGYRLALSTRQLSMAAPGDLATTSPPPPGPVPAATGHHQQTQVGFFRHRYTQFALQPPC